jgi:hypothetical protein
VLAKYVHDVYHADNRTLDKLADSSKKFVSAHVSSNESDKTPTFDALRYSRYLWLRV